MYIEGGGSDAEVEFIYRRAFSPKTRKQEYALLRLTRIKWITNFKFVLSRTSTDGNLDLKFRSNSNDFVGDEMKMNQI